MTHRSERPRLRINERLVREKDRERARELRRFLVCGALVVVPLLAYVWQRIDFIRTSYRLESLRKEKAALEDLNRKLTVERSHLLAPDRIESLARRRLGMVEPDPRHVRRVLLVGGRVDTLARGAAPAGPGRRPGAGTAADGGPDPGTTARAALLPLPPADRDGGERR
jgi:cell division protein FtsL